MSSIEVNQIHYTTDYSKFKEFRQQREFSQRHCDNLVNDPTFKVKFQTSPIVVCRDGTNLKIIDGNHRFAAAKKLKIPIFYIIDKNGSVEDMKRRNSQCKTWSYKDYLQFYVTSENKNYIYIQKLMKEFHIPLTFVNLAIQKMTNIHQGVYSKSFKDGDLDIIDIIPQLSEFFERVMPEIKNYTAMHGMQKARPLVTQAYWYAYVHYFKNERKIFEKFFSKLVYMGDHFPVFIAFEDARTHIKKMASRSAVRLNSETNLFLDPEN